MIPTVELLKKALRKCAEEHNVPSEEWSEDGQFGIKSESVPVVADVRSICTALCGNASAVETGWGYTNVYLDEAEYNFLPEANEVILRMALPAGTEL